ncbi:MAG: hypothetical protein R3E97_21760 [Candidatus Eisenbacteria bacterium]
MPDSVDVSALGAGAAGITEALRRRPGALDAWSETEPLVAVPFLFRRTAGTFLWPAESSSFLSGDERAFLDRNLDFFQDRRSVEVFSNIATDFADEKLRADASRNVGTRAGSVASAGAEPRNAEADAETGVRSNADGTANAESRTESRPGATNSVADKAAEEFADHQPDGADAPIATQHT